jgi:NADH:ubiquinone oxidoreductase subunit D
MYEPIIAELQRERQNLMSLCEDLAARRVRVTEHPPGRTPRDITDQYEAEFRKARNTFSKAVTILEQVETGR